jgi:hypothetical protein
MSEKYYTVRCVARMNGLSLKTFNRRRLTNTSQAMEYGVKKSFDANDGDVNAYHEDVWKHEYPHLKYGE